MKQPLSIRARLVIYLVAGVGLLEILAGAGLFAYMSETLMHSLDTAMAAKAQAIAGAVAMEDDGKAHLHGNPSELSDSSRRDDPFYFQIWRSNGQTLARFGPPGDDHAMSPARGIRKEFGDIQIGGRKYRAIRLSFKAQPDDDEFDPPSRQPPPTPEAMTLLVLHDRDGIDDTLGVLLTGLLFTVLLETAGIVLIVGLGVRRGLAPLVTLSHQLGLINPATLDARLAVSALPAELIPISVKLNELLERLEAAFARERRFSADIAHELRTPITELRTLCEVNLRWPEGEASTQALEEALLIVSQMGTAIESLLSLFRFQMKSQMPAFEVVDVGAVMQELWIAYEPRASKHELCVQIEIAPRCIARTDLQMLRLALRNLLSNAITHVSASGNIHIRVKKTDQVVRLTIGNSSDQLEQNDIDHLCEPLWRKDSARGNHESVGLGLAITQECCRAMNALLSFTLPRENWFEAIIQLPADVVCNRSDAALIPGCGDEPVTGY